MISTVLLIWAMSASSLLAIEAKESRDWKMKCKKSTLTQEKFLEMIKAIIMHGDLEDVPFIEKTLRQKIKTHTGSTNSSQELYYSRESESPIAAGLDISDYRDTLKDNVLGKQSILALSQLSGRTSVFHNCGNLLPSQFDRLLFNLTQQHVSTNDSALDYFEYNVGITEKNGTRTLLGYGLHGGAIDSVIIKQHPPIPSAPLPFDCSKATPSGKDFPCLP